MRGLFECDIADDYWITWNAREPHTKNIVVQRNGKHQKLEKRKMHKNEQR